MALRLEKDSSCKNGWQRTSQRSRQGAVVSVATGQKVCSALFRLLFWSLVIPERQLKSLHAKFQVTGDSLSIVPSGDFCFKGIKALS